MNYQVYKALQGEIRSNALFLSGLTLGRPTGIPIPLFKSRGPKKARRPSTLRGALKQREFPPAIGWDEGVERLLSNLALEAKADHSVLRPKATGVLIAPSMRPARVVFQHHGVLVPAEPVSAQVVLIEHEPFEPIGSEKKWAFALLQQIGGLGYTWTLSQADRNRLTHALNGNISVLSILFGLLVQVLQVNPTNYWGAALGVFSSFMHFIPSHIIYRHVPLALDFASFVGNFRSLFSSQFGDDLEGLPFNDNGLIVNFVPDIIYVVTLLRGFQIIGSNYKVQVLMKALMTFFVTWASLTYLVMIVQVFDILAFAYTIMGLMTLNIYLLSVALGCFLFTATLFLMLYYILMILMVFIETLSVRMTYYRPEQVEKATPFLETAILFASVLEFFLSIYRLDNKHADALNKFVSNLPWTSLIRPVRYTLGLIAKVFTAFVAPFVFIHRLLEGLKNFDVVGSLSFDFWMVIIHLHQTSSAKVGHALTFIIFMPINFVVHLVNSFAFVKFVDYEGQAINAAWSCWYTRLAFGSFIGFVIYPLGVLFFPALSLFLFIILPVLTLILSFIFSLVILFGYDVPDGLKMIASLVSQIPVWLNHTSPYRSGVIPTTYGLPYCKRWLLTGVQLYHDWAGHHEFCFWARVDGKILVIRQRDTLPTDPVVISALFRQYLRTFNRPQFDLFILVSFIFILLLIAYKTVKGFFNVTAKTFKTFLNSIVILLVCLALPDIILLPLIGHCWTNLYLLYSLTIDLDHTIHFDLQPKRILTIFRTIRSLLRFAGLQGWFLIGYIDLDVFPDPDHVDIAEKHGELPQTRAFAKTYTSMVRSTVKRFIFALEDFRLPEFVQAQYRAPTVESIRSTYRTLADLGFPVDKGFIDSIDTPNNEPYLNDWASLKSHLVAVTDFKFSIPRLKMVIAEELRDFGFPEIPGYIHTSTYTSIDAELESTNRYYTPKPDAELGLDDFNDIIDAAWDHVKVQYGNSKLASPYFIFKHWVKKYNLGFGFRVPKGDGKFRQMKRAEAIKLMGGKRQFLRAWTALFKLAPSLVGVSPVFTKLETLKLKKALNRQVRTVVGSAFTHSVLTYIFNFKPNHNYHPWESSGKVGMPINGASFSTLFESMLKHDFVWAGDMTAFDSSVPPVIVRLVAELRKKGYDHHRDSSRICELIDVAYEQLINQPLGFKSLGTIHVKERGFTTGHTSTTADNTLALLVVYLFAWRRVTGLRAREFFNFNTLANFGDDHILGWDAVFGWSPAKAALAMADIGIIMRDEGEGQNSLPDSRAPNNGRDLKIAFLSKKPLHISKDVYDDLKAAGVTRPLTFASCHDKERLIGKIKGQVDSKKGPLYRYQRLASYLDLCAHHRDVYDRLRSALARLEARHAKVFKRAGKQMPPLPSYLDVVRKWYEKGVEPGVLADEMLPDDEHNKEIREFSLWEASSPFDYFMRWISDVPTMLSPRYTNTRWADWIQAKAAKQLSWPLAFIGFANNITLDVHVLRELVSRTPYNFLRNPAISPYLYNGNRTTLLVRHWIYNLYIVYFTRLRSTISLLDYFRILDHSVLNLCFIAFGKVIPVLVELDLHFFDIIIIILLDQIHLPEFKWVEFISAFNPSAPTTIVGGWITLLINYISPSGAVDLQPLIEAIRNIRNGDRFVLDAPTGTGKSTRMVDTIQNIARRRVIVIEPRHILVTGLVEYMNTLFPNTGIGGSTEGLTPSLDDRIIYCTAQSFLLSANLRDPASLFLFDEAHVDEPAYRVVHNYLVRNNLTVIYMTATPLEEWGLQLLAVPAVNTFRKDTFDINILNQHEYFSKVLAYIHSRGPFEKHLVFVNSRREAFEFRDRLNLPSSVLTSQNKEVDPNSIVYISTSVADAGLTIPDVSTVHTMDVGINVSSVDFFTNPVVSHFRLPNTTLKQRIGRTGRTCNGMIFIYRLGGHAYHGNILEVKPPATALDYVNSLGAAITLHFNILPIPIQERLRNLFTTFANLEHRSQLFDLREVTYTEFDVTFGLNSEELMQRVTPHFARGFRNAFDFLSGELGDLFHLDFTDIGLPGVNRPIPLDPSSRVVKDFVTSRNTGTSGLRVLHLVESPAMIPSVIPNVDDLDIPHDSVATETHFDDFEAPRLVLNDVGFKYFGGIRPSQAGLGPANLDLPQELSDATTSSYDGGHYKPESLTGHIDESGEPHAYRAFETPRILDPSDRSNWPMSLRGLPMHSFDDGSLDIVSPVIQQESPMDDPMQSLDIPQEDSSSSSSESSAASSSSEASISPQDAFDYIARFCPTIQAFTPRHIFDLSNYLRVSVDGLQYWLIYVVNYMDSPIEFWLDPAFHNISMKQVMKDETSKSEYIDFLNSI